MEGEGVKESGGGSEFNMVYEIHYKNLPQCPPTQHSNLKKKEERKNKSFLPRFLFQEFGEQYFAKVHMKLANEFAKYSNKRKAER
jgi:hypothetical protein